MAIKDVDTKCFILALFIRSDGARFLLGSGAYEFKDSQQHFAANTMENDVVEVQGNDGYLLAGQVRRPGVQSFDGYVGDAGTDKAAVEGYRREFFSFFRKNFTYRVIYVFPDGSAIQRKRGFIVDAPVVQELYQIYPEYHVALNFEDINYYQYNEDADGNEIYGKSAVLGLTVAASGGLVWDSMGAVSMPYTWTEPVEFSGSEVTVMNGLSVGAPIEELRFKGDTYQQTYTGKNLFLPIPNADQGLTSTYDASSGIAAITGTGNTSWSNAFSDQEIAIPAGTYTFSLNPSINLNTRIWVFAGSTRIADAIVAPGNTYVTFSIPSAATSVRVWFSGTSGVTVNWTGRLQLESGSTATSFEPYVGGVPSPNPDYPQEIQTVTGEQTVTVTGDGGVSQSYTIDLGSTELCKIGEYQDYIYKSGGAWYVHKEIGEIVLNGSEDWGYQSGDRPRFYLRDARVAKQAFSLSAPVIMFSNYFIGSNWYKIYAATYGDNLISSHDVAPGFYVRATSFASLSDWETWLGTHNTAVYYALATPTETEITDTTLIGQLEALGAMKLYVGENNLLVTASGTNLPAVVEGSYYSEIDYSGAGYVWEAGGDGGPKVLTIDSIDDVYPLLTVTGPAVNPTITNITAGVTFTYAGTVTNSQVLKVDMMNKTATLNGTSVIGNVSGDWLYFQPGDNRVEYTTENANAPDALIEWQEVVG